MKQLFDIHVRFEAETAEAPQILEELRPFVEKHRGFADLLTVPSRVRTISLLDGIPLDASFSTASGKSFK